MSDGAYFTALEAARELGVLRTFVYSLLADQRLSGTKDQATQEWRIDAGSVERLKAARAARRKRAEGAEDANAIA